MKSFTHHRFLYISLAIAAIFIIIFMAVKVSNQDDNNLVTAIISTGPVRELVSVSGIAKAEQTAELAFPTTGIVKTVQVKTGDNVATGDIIATLDTKSLSADRQDALASLARAVADRDELLSGPTTGDRAVTNETLQAKKTALANTIENESRKVSNAYSTLLSSDLIAYSNDLDEDALPPTISGTYSCEKEGEYKLDIYTSGSNSGYSYRLSGIESGTYSVSTDQISPLGSCGLQIKFDANSNYNRGVWIVSIPNTKSSQYVANRNSHALAITQAESAISAAKQEVALAEATASNQNAPARTEAIDRANSSIAQAQARLSRVDAAISDRTLRAPFSGVITDIDILPGETVTTAPVVTLLGSDKFEITARIPEIDVGKLLVGQKVEMLFDARSDEILNGEISFISPKSTEIDGVSYYEAIIQLDIIPVWIRSGLNADIEIIIKKESGGLRVPKRFVTKTSNGYEVSVFKNGYKATSTIEVILEGNDGFMSIIGLNEGDVIVAP